MHHQSFLLIQYVWKSVYKKDPDSYYIQDQVPDVLDAFAEWQTSGASVDNKSTVAMVISLDSVVVGLLYSQPTATQPAAFAPFHDLNPAEVAVAGSNGTITELMELW